MRKALIALGAVVLLAVCALWFAQSDWLHETIRRGVIEQAERATGGRVELGAFQLNWKTLTAEFDRFTIHGNEPAGQAPLLFVEKAVVGLRVISLLRRDVSIRSIVAEKPAAHIIVHSDGTTNIPKPKTSGKPFDETILDLKIASFHVKNGTAQVEREGEGSRILPWSAHGENLLAHATYDVRRARYAANVALAPLRVYLEGQVIDATVTASAAMERNRISISAAHLEAQGAVVDLSDGVFDGTLTANYRGHFAAKDINVASEGLLHFTSLNGYLVTGTATWDVRGIKGGGRVEAAPALITVRDAHAIGYGGDATFNGELRDLQRFRATGDLRHVHLKSLPLELPYDGFLSGSFEAAGNLHSVTSGSLRGNVSGPAANGVVDVRYTGSKIEFGHTWVELPHTRVDLSGTLGDRLDVRLQSTDVLDFSPLLKQLPTGLKFGQIAFNGTVSGTLKDPRIAGHIAAKQLTYSGEQFDSIAGEVTATKSGATIHGGTVVYSGIPLRGDGSIELSEWKASDASRLRADIETTNTDLIQVLTFAGHKEVELSGLLSTSAQITGTLANPQATGDVTLSHGSIYGQPFDTITGRVQVANKTSQSITGLLVSGPKRVNITARFEHAGTRFPAGMLEFNLTSNTMPLNQIALVRKQQPDILGFGKFHADGSLRIAHDARHELQFDLLSLNADASANGLELTGRSLGDARFTAQTKDGVLNARFDSNAAKASIHGEGTVRLADEYPVDGKITFTNAGLNALATLISKPEDAKSINFDGTAEGQMTLKGPLKRPTALAAEFDVTHLEVHALTLPDFSVTNNGPLGASITTQTLRVENARLSAPQTDLTVGGTVTMNSQLPMNLQMRGTVNLAIARTFIPDLTSSGTITLDAAVKGNWNTPDFTGRAAIHGADFHYADFSNGLTNANGELVFTGTRATIQSFTADSGGGKVDASGFAALSGGTLAFRLETNAHAVRLRYPEGVSSVSDAHVTLAGTSQRSQASGTVTIHRVAISPKSDTATILASTTQPVRTPAVRTGLIENVNLDVQINTAPDVTLETSVTQTVQADANLRLRGTITNPAILGRINITQGELIFFGNKYSINQGSISFYNPAKIDPILNVDLETRARGVDVILTVSGPVDKLNVSYRSDPPLQFSDIIALLATGRSPGDPTSAVRDTGQSQSFQQLGASTLLGQAIANPVAGRLQRFFGVSRLKIDPQLSGITGSPQARLTIEQQVTPDILFTYITDVASTSTQLIRVEWAYNRHWSAVLTREENGYVGLDFAYKKRFK